MGVRVMIEVFLCDLYILSNDTSTRFVTLPRQAFMSAFFMRSTCKRIIVSEKLTPNEENDDHPRADVDVRSPFL